MYVKRDSESNIVAVYAKPQFDGQEFVEGAEVAKTQEQINDELKLIGVEFEGVMCSATSKDMWGLNAVEGWVAAGQSVPFEFENGNVLVITPTNIVDFKAEWTFFRASFFPMPV